MKSPNTALQTRNALGNLRTVLSEAGSILERVLQLRIYVRGEVADHLPQLMPCLLEFLGATRPAVTGVGVSALASPVTLVEIEAIARVKQTAQRGNCHESRDFKK